MKSEYYKKRTVGGIYSESTGEYTLPDFNADVKRVLSVSPRLTVGEVYEKDGGISYTGYVNYGIIYLDFENNLTHTSFRTDYELHLRCDMNSYVKSSCDSTITGYNVRLVSPRKFVAKCAIASSVKISEREEISVEGDTFESDSVEKLTETVGVASMEKERSGEHEWEEVVERLPGVLADECEVLAEAVEVKNDSVTDVGGSLLHKGVFAVKCLVACRGEVPHEASVNIPFELKYFDKGDKPERGIARARQEVLSVKVNVVPDDEGVTISAAVIAEGEVTVSVRRDIDVVKDAYSTKRGCENRYGRLKYPELVGGAEDRLEISKKITDTECGCEGVRNVLFADATAKITGTESEGKNIKIRGEIRFCGVACQINEEGSPSYVGVKTDIPFEKNVNVSWQASEGDQLDVRVNLSDVAIDVDGNHLVPKCVCEIFLDAMRERECECLVSSHLTEEEFENEEGVITVYYPDRGETLFDVAKKYHRSLVSVASVNSITESVFNDTVSPIRSLGVDKLIIR